MFRLKATLVDISLARPWRTGWSADRGVDFSLAATARPEAPAPAASDAAPAEPVCFIDEHRAAPDLAGPDAVAEPRSVDTPGLRAWWSAAGKPSRT
jgi:hypothetical protein